MADFIYTIPPLTITENIEFKTDILPYDTLTNVPVGSPVTYPTVDANLPTPMFPLRSTKSKATIVSSDEIRSKREFRSQKFEKLLQYYNLEFHDISPAQANALRSFFIARKGKYNNFYISYPELFDGVSTLVRFTEDTLSIQLKSYKRFYAKVQIGEAYNAKYIPQYYTQRTSFTLQYTKDSLEDIDTFFSDTAIGRYATFNFNPSSLVSYLYNQTYLVRMDIDQLERDLITDDYSSIANISLVEVIV